MLDDTSDIPTFRPSDIVECSTPIRLSDTSSQNSLDDEMDLTMISLSSSSANDTTQVRNPRAQNETVKAKKVCASDVGNNNYSQLEPLDISDDSIDANDVQEVNTLTEENAVEKSPKIRQLKVVLYKMSPDYIQAMLNGVKFTQPARGAIKRNERPKTKSKETNKKSDQTFDADVNYKDWQWQPNLKLRRLKEIDVEKFKMSRSRVSPIEFDDSDESIIRELSPKKATILFERRLEVIKKTMQPILMKPNEVRPKRSRPVKRVNPHQLEYEETLKRLREKKRPRSTKRKVGRKLYNPSDSSEEMAEKENDEYSDMEPYPKRARISSLQPTRVLPNRSAKNITPKSS